jgi:hypothetical protein
MVYHILPYSYKRARKLRVKIRPSRNTKKKIDVLSKKGELLASVGASGMNDYPTYIKNYGKTYAEKRRHLYKMRHEKDRHVKGSAGYYADQILW